MKWRLPILATPMKTMLLYTGIFFLLVFGIYGAKKGMMMWYFAHFQPPAITVSSTKAESTEWQPFITTVGSLSAINGVDVSTEAPGTVKTIKFESGQMIKKGQTILTLDTQVEEAELKSNKAAMELAKLNYEREQTLYKKKVSSKSTLDTRFAQLEEAIGSVEATQAHIRQKTIVAPFSGRLGIRLVDLGEYVSAGKALVTLQTLDPLFVNLNVPEQYLPDLKIDQPVEISVNFGEETQVTGKITAINSKVSQTTRNVLIQATIPNKDNKLYPGMFATAKIWIKEPVKTLIVPETAVSYSLNGDYVFAVKKTKNKHTEEPELTVSRQYVKVGEHRKGKVSIVVGLKDGDEIVTSGQLKLQNGARIKINNSVEV